jgi:hypothetical protein
MALTADDRGVSCVSCNDGRFDCVAPARLTVIESTGAAAWRASAPVAVPARVSCRRGPARPATGAERRAPRGPGCGEAPRSRRRAEPDWAVCTERADGGRCPERSAIS